MATTSHNQHDGNARFQILMNDIVAELEAEAGGEVNEFIYQEVDADDYENDDSVIIIATTFGTRIVIEETFIQFLFTRMCREIIGRGDNFEVLDFFNGQYDDSLEFLINFGTECFRRELSSFWTPQDQDHLFLTTFDRVREFSFFLVLQRLPESLGRMIIRRYLNTRWNDDEHEEGTRYGEDDVCPVCLDPMIATKTTIAMLDCGHEYHDDCIVSWLIGENNTCPLCREKAIRDWKSATMRFQQSLLEG